MKKLLACGASAALAVASMGIATGSAQAGSENWGDNGFGACTSLNDSAYANPASQACVPSLSGWVSVKPWTIFNAKPTCEDTLNGPYPYVAPATANTDGPWWVFSGQAWYAAGSDGGPPGSHGIAWQGDGIDSDVADGNAFYGNWDGDLSIQPVWGTGSMAFGNPDLFGTKTAQYALACLSAGSQGFGEYFPSSAESQGFPEYFPPVSASASPTPTLRYTHNPSPAERKRIIPRSSDSDTHVLVWRRITVKPFDTRKITLRCPSGYERSGLLQLTHEHAPADMQAPTSSEIKKNQVTAKSQIHQPKQARFTVKSNKLNMTTVVHAHLPCSTTES